VRLDGLEGGERMLGGHAAVLRRAAESREHPSGRADAASCYGLARRLAHALRTPGVHEQGHGRSSRKRARQACGPLPYVARVGSEHVVSVGTLVGPHASMPDDVRLSDRVFCVCDLVRWPRATEYRAYRLEL
jgi:hypothetical protein